MRTATIGLPKVRRARGGWALYGAYEESMCPYHQFCSFTGDEPERCQICHGLHSTDKHGEIPPGRTAPCLCPMCKELFTSKTAFNKHKRPNGKCYNPEKRGLVLVNQNDWFLWANPGSRPDDIRE
ncbi:MAG TPA: hypothetical protein VNS88_17500 [Nitrospiraceae bacterium]|nr:hypothetical protein [Nitrospiraceae bacterium]